MVEEQTAEIPIESTQEANKRQVDENVGVLDGWEAKEEDVDGLEEIEFVMDEDMKRTKEARRTRARRW